MSDKTSYQAVKKQTFFLIFFHSKYQDEHTHFKVKGQKNETYFQNKPKERIVVVTLSRGGANTDIELLKHQII